MYVGIKLPVACITYFVHRAEQLFSIKGARNNLFRRASKNKIALFSVYYSLTCAIQSIQAS
jgi:hypothetical protein